MKLYHTTLLYKAFTLIELLIVIIIIGILAAALIPRIIGMQDKARYTRVDNDFQNFRTAVFLAQTNTKKSLVRITGSDYTMESCTSGAPSYTVISDLRNLPPNHPCRIDFIEALRKISVAAGMNTGALDYMALDPRGSPYLFDQNDRERGSCAYSDTLNSAGPDGSAIGVNGGDANLNTGDNRGVNIKPYDCPGGY